MKKALLPIAIVAAVQANAGTVTTDGADLVINTKGGLKVKTSDDKYSFGVAGRIQWDYNRSELNGDVDENDTEIRRARLAFTGSAGDFSFKSQFNLSENGGDAGDVEDLYIRYNGWGKAAKLTIGKQKEPFGLEELTSSKDISVLERSAITEFYAPGRNTGVQLSGAAGNLYYGAGFFERGEDGQESSDVAFTGRVAFTPLAEKNLLVHVGAAYSSRGDLDLAGLELAGVFGSFHAQAEYQQAEIDGLAAGVDDDFDGYYIQAGWIITGESRPYKGGKFKRVKPQGDAGAWELVLRYEDGEGNFSDIELGADEASAYTLGVNYYYNNNVRFGLNYTDGDSDTNDNDGEEIRFRTQFVF